MQTRKQTITSLSVPPKAERHGVTPQYEGSTFNALLLSALVTYKKILADGVQRALKDPNAHVTPQNYQMEYEQLIQDQNEIGWLQTFRGRWAKQWTSCYILRTTQERAASPKEAATTWVQNCSKFFLSRWWELWKIRTAERHGHDLETRTARLHSVVQSHLEHLYNERPHIMPVDRHIFPHANAIDHLESPGSLDAKLEWCLEMSTAIQASKTQAARRGILTNQDIRMYMPQDNLPSSVALHQEPSASHAADGT